VRTSLCLSPQALNFGQLCSSALLTGYSGTGVGRLDFVGSQVVVSGGGTETISFNYPQSCLTGAFNTCSALSSTSITCPVAAPPRTGCDCSSTNTSQLTSEVLPWTGSGGLLTVGAGASTNTWKTCVIPGAPDVLMVNQTGSYSTWERRR
jgi:hypothetical protein